MGNSSTSWKPGFAQRQAGKTFAEKNAMRTIQEAFRSLADPMDLGRSLLALYAGKDPFKEEDPNRPDYLPRTVEVPIDMTHRMAAIKLYLEYAWGKPLQGLAIKAEIASTNVERTEHEDVLELQRLAQSDPSVRDAIRALAGAFTGGAKQKAVIDIPDKAK